MTREEAINELTEKLLAFNPNDLGYEEVERFVVALDMAIEALKEPKQGAWINTGEAIGDDIEVKCSLCGEELYWLANFCPNCGADMRDKNELNRVSKELNSDNSTLLYSMTTGDNFIGKEGEAEC